MPVNPVARTNFGEVEGEGNEGVARFRGVPYADRIDGPGRYQPPRPPRRWSGVRKAQSWAPMTPQVGDGALIHDAAYHRFLFGPFYDMPMSEDGLFLNVWTPSLDRNAKRPVMVWLHGGGFLTGVATRPRDEPSLLAQRGDLVVVSPNHRLGALGYLYREIGGAPAIPPNLGMLDIVAALEWVRDNIEAFGGDPGNVTVLGESGGAMKTATLLSMPKAKGLFHRGICQAGVFAKGFMAACLTPAAADAASKALMGRLGLGDDVAALASVPIGRLIGADESAGGGGMRWRPVVDGEILPVDPAQALIDGAELNVPMLAGWAAHEADFIFRGAPYTRAELEKKMGAARGGRLFEGYAASRPKASEAEIVEAILTDWIFGMPTVEFAEARAASGHRTYLYQMAWGRADDASARATHGVDAPFIFDRLETMGFSADAPDAAPLAQTMQRAWIAFARSGDPGSEWPPYGTPERAIMVFDRAPHLAHDPKGADREAWRRA